MRLRHPFGVSTHGIPATPVEKGCYTPLFLHEKRCDFASHPVTPFSECRWHREIKNGTSNTSEHALTPGVTPLKRSFSGFQSTLRRRLSICFLSCWFSPSRPSIGSVKLSKFTEYSFSPWWPRAGLYKVPSGATEWT